MSFPTKFFPSALFFAVLLYGSESAESVSVFGIAFTGKNDIIDFGKADPKAPTKIFLQDALSLSLYQQNGKKRIGTEEMNEIKNTKSDFEQKIDNLKQMLQSSRRVVFLGGAGVSTESGISDFRSENGIFKAIQQFGYPPEELLSHTFFVRKPDVFFRYYKTLLLTTDAKPNAAHAALAKLEAQGKLTAVVTQNIDGLHQLAGSKNVYELHGSIHRNHCMRCNRFFDAEYVKNHSGIPYCPCGGMIKPDVVLYEESLDPDVLAGSVAHISRADMLIVGGTSLQVYPAAGLINYYSGNKLVLINKTITPYDNYANLVINDSIGKVLSAAVE